MMKLYSCLGSQRGVLIPYFTISEVQNAECMSTL